MNNNNNVFKFHGNNMIVCVKGPNINQNLSSRFRSNSLSSTLNLPRNFERQGYAESLSSQRSMFYGRELSPTASVRSYFQPRNFYQPFNQGYSQKSAYNGRGGSPVSMRSIDSTASVASFVYSNKSLRESKMTCQKDRFKSGLQSSSHRFNKSVMHTEEKNENVKSVNKKINNTNKRKQTSDMDDNSSEDDTIFNHSILDTTRSKAVSKNNNTRQKRDVECLDDVPVSAKKKCKTTLNNNKTGHTTKSSSGNNDFVFFKPQFPVSKKPIEKLISKSAEPFSDIAFNIQEDNTRVQTVDAPGQEKKAEHELAETTMLSNSDVSMRPSFMKRKLFTQTLDNTERKNNSNESLSTDSPQSNIYRALLREKHKTRKLTTSQSLLSRDVNQDDNNLLDLIHKIVPPSGINTNIAKPSHSRANENKTVSDWDDKWDISSILTTCNNDSVSDTYTDDEIFKVTDGNKTNKTNKCTEKGNKKQHNENNDKKKTNNKSEINKDAMAKCYVIIQKLTTVQPASTKIKSPVKADIAFNIQEDNTRVQTVDAPGQEKKAEHELAETTMLSNSDVSMRPSFMKRKLFTQTLDITERKNNSNESLSTDSPQSNIYSALLREKHKTRKLTTSQSLLSRDVNQDDNNLLDLIHKIVPPSGINTNIAKPSHSRANENKTVSDWDDKWDISSILTTCNNDSVSDTYTDDEIFKVTDGNKTNKTNKCTEKGNKKQHNENNDKKKTNNKSEINKDAMAKCYVIIQKLTTVQPASTKIKSPVKAGPVKKATLSNSRIDAFWNTDSESDYECPATPHGLKEKYLTGTSNNNNIATPKQIIKSFPEVRPNTSANKISNNAKTQISSLVVNKNDTTLVKALKKQTNKKITTKPSTTTLKNTNNKEAQPEQIDKIKKGPTAKMLKTRRQTKNLSAVEESCSPNDDLPIRTIDSEANSKQINTRRTKKITKTQPASASTKKQNRSLNNSQSQTDNTRKPKHHKNAIHQPQAKTKFQDDVQNIQNGSICKVLRSRTVDISSSFNSDKFELTGLSLARKSRTPSKRISFNKSRNATVKRGL